MLGQVKYTFRAGHRMSGVNPQDVGEELARIREADGKLEASRILEEAKPKDSPLHPAFEWNNGKAARMYRLEQSRKMIRAVCVVRKEGQEPATQYVHVSNEGAGQGHYQDITEIAKDVSEFDRALHEAMVDLAAAERRVNDLKKAVDDQSENAIALISVAADGLSMARRALDKVDTKAA